MQKLTLLSMTLLVSMGVFIASLEGWSFYRFVTQPVSTQPSVQVVTIPVGSSAPKVAQILYDHKIIHETKWFLWVLKYQDKAHLLKAGEFKIDSSWTVNELIDGLIEGKSVQYPITFISGLRAKESILSLEKANKLTSTLFVEGVYDEKAVQKLLGLDRVKNSALEGQLLPETYHYLSGDTDKTILLRAHKALKSVLQEAWDTRAPNLPIKTPYEALILASIVEKETGYSAERPMIAGVFVNRLRRGMRLQSDPTIIYGMGNAYNGNIRKKDIQKKTAYNTYRINGLPPTPIALASADAIRAVCNPEKTKALYFVAKGGGQHYFSKNLKEHNRAVRKYLLNK